MRRMVKRNFIPFLRSMCGFASKVANLLAFSRSTATARGEVDVELLSDLY